MSTIERSLSMPVMILLTLCLAMCSAIRAEAPGITALFPAGLQVGQQAEIKLVGKPGTLPLHAWCNDEAVTLHVDEKGESLSVTCPVSVMPGLRWIRLFNSDGATDLKPLLIGVLPEIAEIEDNNALADAQSIESLPQTINGVLEKRGDLDTYATMLKAGQTLVASIEANRSLGSPMDAVLQLVSEQGFVIAQNDDHRGFDPQLVVPVPADGRYHVRVFAFPATPDSSISYSGANTYVYRLTLTCGSFVDHVVPRDNASQPDTAVGWNLDESPQPITEVPGSHTIHQAMESSILHRKESIARGENSVAWPIRIAGALKDINEFDQFVIDAAKGQKLLFDVFAGRLDSPLDPLLRIRDADGKLLKEADDVSREQRDVTLFWTSPAAGRFTVEIGDRFGHAGLRYRYDLLIEEDQPRFNVTVSADHYLLEPDKTVEIPITINRTSGFDGEIMLQAEGLPTGVTAEPVVSAAKGDTAKAVKLKLSGTAASEFNEPFRIIATAGATAMSQSAIVDLKIGGHSTSAIWLTAKPKPPIPSEKPLP